TPLPTSWTRHQSALPAPRQVSRSCSSNPQLSHSFGHALSDGLIPSLCQVVSDDLEVSGAQALAHQNVNVPAVQLCVRVAIYVLHYLIAHVVACKHGPDHVELAHNPGDHFKRFARRADLVQNPVCQVAHVPQSSSISSNSRPTASAITAISPNVSLSHSLLFISA